MGRRLASSFLERTFAHEPVYLTCRSTISLRRSIHASSPRKGSLRRREDRAPKPKVTLADLKDREAWNKRSEFFQDDIGDAYRRHPTVTAEILRTRRTRPRRVKMLLRDFIDAVIFDCGQAFDWSSLRTGTDFLDELQRRYDLVEDRLDFQANASQATVSDDLIQEQEQPADTPRMKVDRPSPNELRQMWHTPTELFKPYYAEAIARYMATNYKLSQYPYHDLLIYEMGAGNGTFMINVLDYLRDVFPEVYERTKFRIIEVSSALADLQQQSLLRSAQDCGHVEKVEIINKSIFDWDSRVSNPCFFVALEVWDNFAHDAIRYDPHTHDAYQTWVLIDREGEFYEYHEPCLDPVAMRFLRIRDETVHFSYDHPLKKRDLRRHFMKLLPGSGSNAKFTTPEYIPTRLMQFFDILYNYFPAHRLVVSDFNSFPSEVRGVNAPAVQTRFRRKMLGVTTPLVHQGYFDILFPINFPVMECIYRAMTGRLTSVMSQEDFLNRWADIEETRTRNGENPLLDWYKNASMMLTL